VRKVRNSLLVVGNENVLEIGIGRQDQVTIQVSYACSHLGYRSDIRLGGHIDEPISQIVVLMNLCKIQNLEGIRIE